MQFAHDDLTKLASSSLDGSLAVHVVLPEPETCFVLKHPKGVTGFCWSYSNDLIMSCSEDGYARLFNSSNGSCIRAIHGFQSGASVLTGIFHPVNNNMIVVSFLLLKIRVLSTLFFPTDKQQILKRRNLVYSSFSRYDGIIIINGTLERKL